ncbi:tubulin polyglutamylase complex subunit 2 [Teleopsis dalmanni]|uniref:tubulin polyglutamylase complex subunit 2 n=1 Tax=Teleopsis dalmanni TaxID=139649 RepID=UPI0018CCB1DB|nr:tubulin polyglutamylase complex subunit 2 [Teleopsis dalmanni]
MSKKQTPEEIFYENLTLGLVNTLSNVPRISNVCCEHRAPCEKPHIQNWEQRHCVYLPEDMKKFYLSTDGFLLQWSYQYSPTDMRKVGIIYFPYLAEISLLRDNIEQSPNMSSSESSITQPTQSNPVKDRWGNPTPVMSSKSKVFELKSVNETAKVCLVYESTGTNNPKFYLLENFTSKWQFLADTFSEFLRMSIAHIGLPYWELCFSSFGLPTWAEQLFLLLAPHLLEEHEQRRTKIVQQVAEHPYNLIDPNIFRSKPKLLGRSNAATKHSSSNVLKR